MSTRQIFCALMGYIKQGTPIRPHVANQPQDSRIYPLPEKN